MYRWVIILISAALLGYLATGIFQVNAGELAVVQRFGRVHRVCGPGLHIGWPWGFDRVTFVPLQQQELRVGFEGSEERVVEVAPAGQLLTGDDNLVNVQATIFLRPDPEHVADYVLHRDRVLPLVQRAAEAALAQVFATQPIQEILLNRARHLEPELHRQLAAYLRPYRLGILVEAVTLATPQPPDEVAEDFQATTIALAQAARLQETTRMEAELARSRALQEARALLTQAENQKREKIAQAMAQAYRHRELWRSLAESAEPAKAVQAYYVREVAKMLRTLQLRRLSDGDVEFYFVTPAQEP
ncbi:MAG: SPFH domain-containing protein [Gemmatales bacterium]|nr:SPFH domain-containing protein [Gemmatales bacterium]MDW8221900.1 SPFH domain-containing protein [Gemmatales bacterium]